VRDGVRHIWVDLFCINKWNRRDCRETIISKFTWNGTAARHYVYLAEVPVARAEEARQRSSRDISFRASKPFKRGWALQGLIAPALVQIFSREGHMLGDKSTPQ